MTLDIRARATADNLIEKFGKVVALARITKGAYNPDTGEMAADSTVTQTVSALIKDYNGIELMTGLIQSDDRKVSIAALNATEPATGDTVTIDSLVYNVIAVKTIWSGEKASIYEMQVRK